ncbi:DUF2163 domain-containing protein [uncultured Tateyamaria sp.]|uniref:DUF2163 domain-containing protein n=1 Tax=uncultured Tateyamaria sp. TaxID=455651 RepID=UPI00262C21AC|nr:DUF2163 domain-containing protein [uncultured Tateyamaria sp.]
MAGQSKEFLDHAALGLTTLCRAWAITRVDGTDYGFTDHDGNLEFDGITFRADTGLTASALAQSTGLSVDNTEALGALSDAAIREDDIEAGRFDSAEVRAWLVNWVDPDVRWLQFRGTIGEIRRSGGAFHAELRGLTEALNRPLGRIYQKPCTAVLGDRACGFDVSAPGYRFEGPVDRVRDGRVFEWDALNGFEPNWFTRGRLDVLDGAAAGLWGMIKRDTFVDGVRQVELWEPIRGLIADGSAMRLTAGCDKRFDTCRLKFNNLLNFQGFPDLPSDDWVMAYPTSGGTNSGGSLR